MRPCPSRLLPALLPEKNGGSVIAMSSEFTPESFLRDIEKDHVRLNSMGFSEERIRSYGDGVFRGVDRDEAFADASGGLTLSDEDRDFAMKMLEGFPGPNDI
jgi:hypothetical protein